MKRVELYGRVRYAVRIEWISNREATRRFGIDPRTVAKMLSFSVPLGYRRNGPPARPKLDPFIGIIDRILQEDHDRPAKQRHTSKRIFERLHDEHGYTGGVTIVKDYVLGQRQAFVPLRHDPGHAQADFGEALVVIGELGYVPLSQTCAELLFEVFSQRYERGSAIVTSDLPFDEWTGVFASERLTGALLDRLTHHVHILEMNGDSYRLKRSKRRQRTAEVANGPANPPDE